MINMTKTRPDTGNCVGGNWVEYHNNTTRVSFNSFKVQRLLEAEEDKDKDKKKELYLQ